MNSKLDLNFTLETLLAKKYRVRTDNAFTLDDDLLATLRWKIGDPLKRVVGEVTINGTTKKALLLFIDDEPDSNGTGAEVIPNGE